MWSVERREEFRKAMGELEETDGGVAETWGEMKDRIKKVVEGGCEAKERGGKRGWWDEECKEEKNKVRRELRKWRRGEGDGGTYREAKGKYKNLTERKRREENEKWERELSEIRTEGQVWEVVRRERRRKKRVNEDGGMGYVF